MKKTFIILRDVNLGPMYIDVTSITTVMADASLPYTRVQVGNSSYMVQENSDEIMMIIKRAIER